VVLVAVAGWVVLVTILHVTINGRGPLVPGAAARSLQVAGTAARVKAGEPLAVLPSPIHLMVGVRDVLVLTNDDDAVHQVGPIACSLHAAGTLTLVITPAPAAGLDRLRWRQDQLIARS